MSVAHEHPDFDNVVRVPRFHQAPQRIQYLTDQPANVIVLPVIKYDGRFGRRAGGSKETAAPPR